MIFKCGFTKEERDRQLQEWHTFFPIFPRTVDRIDGKCVCAWLESIERRAYEILWSEGSRWCKWEYRRIAAKEGK